MEYQKIVSTLLFGIQGILTLIDEENRGKRQHIGNPGKFFDPWQFAFDRLITWWTMIIRIVMMLVFVFVLTLSVRVTLIALIKTSLPSETVSAEGASDMQQKTRSDMIQKLKESSTDQMKWVLDFVFNKSFISSFVIWIPFIIWLVSLTYGFVFLRMKSGQTPDAFHKFNIFLLYVVGFIVAFVWCLVDIF